MILALGLVVPGWALLTLLRPAGVPFTAALPASVGLSLSIVSIAAWLGWITHTGFGGVVFLTAVAAAAVIGARFVLRERAAKLVRPNAGDLAPAVIALVAVALALVDGPWLSQTADQFYHLAATRSLLQTQSAMPMQVFFGVPVTYPDESSGSLHVVAAWLSFVTGLIPAWSALNVLGAAFITLAFAAFAREITGSAAAGTAAAALYSIFWLSLDFRTAGYPNHLAPGLVWLTMAFVIRYVRSPGRASWPDLAIAALLAIAASSVHSGMAPFLVAIVGVTFGAAALIHVWRRNVRPLWRLVIAGSVVIASTLPILAIRLLAMPPPGPDAWLTTEAPPIVTHVLGGFYPFIDFRFWFDGLVAFSTVGTVFLIGRTRIAWLRGDVGAALLVGGILVVPALCVLPILPRLVPSLYYFARISDLLKPLCFIPIGWELIWASTKVAAWARTLQRPSAVGAAEGAALAVMAAVVAMLFEYVPQGAFDKYFGTDNYTVAASHHNDLTQRWSDRLSALKAAGDGTLLADLDTSYEIAGLTGRRIVAVSFSHIPYQDYARDGMLRLGDVLDALRPAPDSTVLMTILVRYNVRFVMVDRAMDGEATWKWLTARPALVEVAGGDGWELLRFDPSRLDDELHVPSPDPADVLPTRTIAGRAVFVRFDTGGAPVPYELTATGEHTGAVYRASGTLPAIHTGTLRPMATEPLLFPDSAPVDTYRITSSFGGRETINANAGEVQVGRDYEAEGFGGIIDFYYNGGFIRNPGWLTTYGPYSRGVAAIGLRAGVVASRPLLDPPGDYCLDVRVFDQGDGKQRTIDVGLGGTMLNLTWSGQKAGLRDLVQPVHVGSSNRLISFEVVGGSTVPLTIDNLTLYPPVNGAC